MLWVITLGVFHGALLALIVSAADEPEEHA